MMSLFTTLTPERMEKTHLVKVLPRYLKKGDAKTKWWVNKILTSSETGKEVHAKDDKKRSEKTNGEASQAKAAPVKKVGSASVAGVKRSAAPTTEGSTQKKPTLAKPNGTSSTSRVSNSGAVKKPAQDTSKPAATVSAAGVRKTVVAKPSGFFTNLQTAAKKPGAPNTDKPATKTTTTVKPAGVNGIAAAKPTFSFAETMANLSKPKEEKKAPNLEKEIPQETAEERAKRIRKEQRRKLHVSFKTGDDLVQIRYFTHDPAEENDHDSSQMRDVADIGGEGRMFKQQQHMMDLDDDDDIPEVEERLVDFKTPLRIDFSDVDPEERKRNYAPYGGGEMIVESAERPKREQHENNTLMVFYTDVSQIPPNPKEPENPYTGDHGPAMRYFGAPEDKYISRARNRVHQQPTYTQHQAPVPAFDLAALMGQQQQPQNVPSTLNVQSILDSLRQTTPNQQAQTHLAFPTPFMGAPAANTFAPPPPPQPAVPPGQIDLAAILAQIQSGAQQQQQGGFNYGQPAQQQSNDEDVRTQNPFYKTKTCRFWQEGRCQKGDACSYLHE